MHLKNNVIYVKQRFFSRLFYQNGLCGYAKIVTVASKQSSANNRSIKLRIFQIGCLKEALFALFAIDCAVTIFV